MYLSNGWGRSSRKLRLIESECQEILRDFENNEESAKAKYADSKNMLRELLLNDKGNGTMNTTCQAW